MTRPTLDAHAATAPGTPSGDAPPPYPATCFRELSPVWLNYGAALGGRRGPDLAAPFRYLELGCGQGLSTALHAAAFPQGRFTACDVSEAAVRSAAANAEAHGADNLRVLRADFLDLTADVLPPQDYIVLHGVYSWIDQTHREALHRLLGRCLKPGGLVYLSYNCLPGWAQEQPLRRLAAELGATSAPATGTTAQLARLAALGMRYFEEQPAAHRTVLLCRDADPGYLAQELFGESWDALYSVDVHDALADVGLGYLASATLADNYPALTLKGPLAEAVAALPTARMRRLAGDFAVNRRFRRDLFAHQAEPTHGQPGDGPTGAAPAEPFIGCPGDPAELAATARVPLGRLRFDAGFIAALHDCLADGAMPLSRLRDVLAVVSDRNTDVSADRTVDGYREQRAAAVQRNLEFAVAAGLLAPFALPALRRRGPAVGFAGRRIARRFRDIAASGASGWVASPVAGWAVQVSASEARTTLAQLPQRRLREDPLLARFARLGLLSD